MLLRAGVEPTPFRTGYFGLAEGQGIRVSVFNGRIGARGLLTPCVVPDAVVATVVVRDLEGAPLFRARSAPAKDGGQRKLEK